MAQNNLTASRFKSNEMHLLQTHENYSFSRLGGFLVPDYQKVNMIDLISEASIAPQTSLPNNSFTGSVYVDFEIPKSINILKSAVLTMQIDNIEADKSIIMPPISQLINRIEYYSGSTLIETILSTHLYLESVLETTEKMTLMEASQNISPQTFDESSQDTIRRIGPNGTKTYYLKLNGVLNSTHLFIPGLRSEIRIRIYFENYSKWRLDHTHYSGLGGVLDESTLPKSPQMRRIELRLQQIELAQVNYNKMMNIYKGSTPISLRWLDRRYQTISMQANAGVVTNNVLSAINGYFSHFFICLRKQNAKGYDNYNFLPIEELYFASASGSNLHNGIQYQNDYLRGFYVDQNMERSTVFTKKCIYPVLFCQDFYSTYSLATNTGGMYFSSSEMLYTKPQDNNQVEIGIYGYAYSTMIVRNGLIEVAKS